jgi:hypothetical protein
MVAEQDLPAVCAVCHTRIAWAPDPGCWIHAVTYPRPWHPATPTTASIDRKQS